MVAVTVGWLVLEVRVATEIGTATGADLQKASRLARAGAWSLPKTRFIWSVSVKHCTQVLYSDRKEPLHWQLVRVEFEIGTVDECSIESRICLQAAVLNAGLQFKQEIEVDGNWTWLPGDETGAND